MKQSLLPICSIKPSLISARRFCLLTVRKAFLPAFLFLSFSACAQQVPVVDAASTPARQVAQQDTGPANSGNDLIMSLYMQLEQLQQEVLTLRGQVEELTYRQQRMETEQRDRYLDLDRRLSTLGGGAPADGGGTPAGPGAGGNAALPGGPDNPVLDAGTAGAATGEDPSAMADAIPPTAENEQQIYRQALSFLLEENRYDESISLFQAYIDNYPDGRYLTNAYYWQGEGLLLVERNAEAEAAFKTVVDDYPADPKAAGAMLKLGVAYRELGQEALARETWQRVRDEYPSSLTEISAAEDYLNRLGPQ